MSLDLCYKGNDTGCLLEIRMCSNIIIIELIREPGQGEINFDLSQALIFSWHSGSAMFSLALAQIEYNRHCWQISAGRISKE